jgi:hypothetical protein
MAIRSHIGLWSSPSSSYSCFLARMLIWATRRSAR